MNETLLFCARRALFIFNILMHRSWTHNGLPSYFSRVNDQINKRTTKWVHADEISGVFSEFVKRNSVHCTFECFFVSFSLGSYISYECVTLYQLLYFNAYRIEHSGTAQNGKKQFSFLNTKPGKRKLHCCMKWVAVWQRSVLSCS